LSSKDRPLKCASTAKVASTADSTALAERNDMVSDTSSKCSLASFTFCDQLRRVVSNSCGAAPWKP
jgi:hypothetical protein